jgi:hypothetical protein
LFVSSPGIVLRIHELPPFNLTLSLSLSLAVKKKKKKNQN